MSIRNPSRSRSPQPPKPEPYVIPTAWLTDRDAAKAQATAYGGLVFELKSRQGCIYCDRLRAGYLRTQRFADLCRQYKLVLLTTYSRGTVPEVVICSSGATCYGAIQGYAGPDDFHRQLVAVLGRATR